MFNTLDEYLFVCQSLLKERRRPTGGLREAFKESLGGGVSTPSPPVVGSKTTPGASEVRFPLPEETIGYCFVRSCPNRGVSCRSLFSFCGDQERAYSDRVRNLRVFRGAFFEEEVFSLLHKLRLEQGGVPEGRVSSWRLVSPSCGCKRVISASCLSKPELPIVYSSLWSIWAKDLLRHVTALR